MRHPRARCFGHNLAAVLEDLEMTQSDLAEQSGLTPAAISQILSGAREPSLSSVIRILEVIPIKFEKLVRPCRD